MMAPIFLVVTIINILANINNYNIPDDPELRNIRVRRDNVARTNKQDANIKSTLRGDHYQRRSKRAYYNPNYNVTPTTTPYNQINNGYNNGYQQYTATPYSATHMWQYNPYNIPPKGQQQPVYNQQQPVYNQQQPAYNQQQPAYNQQQPSYNQQQPVYNQQQPVYNQQQPVYNQQQQVYNQQPVYNEQQPVTNNNNGYKKRNGKILPVINETVETTTPRMSCILCDIRCPAFMKRVGIFCFSEEENDEDNDYL